MAEQNQWALCFHDIRLKDCKECSAEQKVVIAEDLKPCLKIQQQILRCFRNDQDAVSVAERTIDLIERTSIAESKLADCDALLGDVLHLWVDSYISKNPTSAAEETVSSEVFYRIEKYLLERGIAVDYCGAHVLIQKHRSQA